MKQILIVDLNGTSPVYTYYYAKSLKEFGYHVEILGAFKKSELEILKPEVDYISYDWIPTKLLRYIIGWLHLVFKTNSSVIIHFQWLQTLTVSPIELTLLKTLLYQGKKVCYTAHNLYPHNNNSNKTKKRYNTLYKTIRNILVHTDDAKDFFINSFKTNNIERIQHGLFFNELNLILETQDKKTLLMAGFVSPYKGHTDAIISFSRFIMKYPNSQLVIAGKGNQGYFDQLNELVTKFGLDEKVVFINKYLTSHELLGLYCSANVVLLPYQNIQQSGVIFTALGIGLPVVGYEVGGLTEVIINDKNGKLVPINNTDALAEAIEWAIANEISIKDSIGVLNSAFRWSNNKSVVVNFYDNVL